MERRKASRSTTQPKLPADIVPYILCRLPIKALSSCRLVCKSWLHLISDPYFFNFYEAHGPSIVGLPAVNTLHNPRSAYVLDFIKGGGPALIRRCGTKSFSFQVLSTCNGLICIIHGSLICVWNPFCNHYFALPKTEDEIWKSSPNFDILYGFGHSRKSNCYKVLRILKLGANNGMVVAEICTVGTDDTWREVKVVPERLHCDDHCSFFDGFLHWIVRDVDSSELICAFDIKSECFGFVAPPITFDSKTKNRFDWSNLGAFRGCLCICASDAIAFMPDYEVWLMKEYGVKDSWVKELSIKIPLVEWWRPYRQFQLLKFIDGDGDDDEEIMILCGDFHLFVYNLKNRTYKTKLETTYSQIAVVPSFVSLKNLVIGNERYI